MNLNIDTPDIEFNSSLLLPFQIQKLAHEHPDRPALIQGDRIVPWVEMSRNINKIANALITMGIHPGQRVAVMGRNSIEYSQLYCGIITAGASAVPLSTMINSETLKTLLQDSEARVIIMTNEFKELFFPIIVDLPLLENRLISLDFKMPGWLTYLDWINPSCETYPNIKIDPDSEFNIIYSSGTTGTPKGIIHTHKIRYAMSKKYYESGEIHVNLVSTPLYSNTTIVCWLPALYSGATNVIMPRFNAREALALIEKHQVDTAMFVPVQYDRMLQLEDFGSFDLSSMKNKFSTSAPLRAHLKKDLLDRFPGTLTEIYGLTEGGPTTIYKVTEFPDRLDSVGQVVEGGILKVIDEEGNEIGCNKIGELVGRHSNMCKGYLNKTEATKAMFWHDREGQLFYKSGDTGYIDESGFVYLLDRKKDMIISGGLNIYATDLELALLTHPAVHDVAVIAGPSKEWGETPVAFVIPKAANIISEKELLNWVNGRLNKFQRISKIIYRDDFPKSPIGKVLKRKLREELNS